MGDVLQISQILNNSQPKMTDSSAKDCDGLYTGTEAKKEGIKIEKPEPAPLICDYCRKPLFYKGFHNPLRNSIVMWLKPDRCTCEGATKYWKKYDEDQAKEEAAAAEAERNEQMKKRIAKLFEQSKIGERFRHRTFETYNVSDSNKQAFENSKKYAERFEDFKNKGVGLMYSGSYGTGKTHLAAAIANYLLNRGTPVIFGTLINLLGKLRDTYNDNREREYEIINLYTSVDLLIIDDLGKEKPSDWVLEKLYSIINDRYERNKPVIITTNYGIQTLTDRLAANGNNESAEAIISRLNEMCRGVLLNGDDYRKL